MSIVLARLQAFVTSVGWLVVRFMPGVPLGSNISNGYTYIMESMPKGKREVMDTAGGSCSPLAKS